MEKAQCSCLKYATRAWQRIDHMVEISLEIIVIATTQTIDFALRSQVCPLHNLSLVSSTTEIRDILLRIYEKLVSFLHIAVTTYTSSDTTPVEQTSFITSGQPKPWSADGLQYGLVEDKQVPSGVVCRPSRMALGNHELSDEESRYLALDMICRSLRNLTKALQQMERSDTANLRKADSRIVTLLFQVTRLLDSVTANLHAWKTS
ncbi:hypothetical protein CNMCM5623_009808 [Aspergillus felis]|uniref:Uncharacterized protein n=1 Tax=Aspergillus felis TaxID=1287682 RepID=A0A8H6Q466_9EURO|nr:hypothetical protein CNMCM5623_009808 [Aspergillus felis]